MEGAGAACFSRLEGAVVSTEGRGAGPSSSEYRALGLSEPVPTTLLPLLQAAEVYVFLHAAATASGLIAVSCPCG